ncbi:hypothetical protein RRG08_004881 [Elysia crispata]|uniref:Uncharacterized protein n=1 Tax=Elysia crispata TaxID=231223 RepID=A0AAE0ZHQ9_9GAST|nr:hypothetical protein RRG08_004881 [Elysia crispata]
MAVDKTETKSSCFKRVREGDWKYELTLNADVVNNDLAPLQIKSGRINRGGSETDSHSVRRGRNVFLFRGEEDRFGFYEAGIAI